MKARLFCPGEDLLDRHPWARGALFNLHGDYRYLGEGYYRSLEAELAGIPVHPTTGEALDAYIAPLASERARQAGLPVADGQLVLERVTAPALVYPVNPFSRKAEHIRPEDDLLARLGSLTRIGMYVALSQPLTAETEVVEMRCILGWSPDPRLALLARKAFDLFRLPLMTLRLLVEGDEVRFSGIDPLAYAALGPEERDEIERAGTWLD